MIKTYTKDTLTREVLEKGVKLRVKDEGHSRAFQRACFDLDVFWGDRGDNRVQLTSEPYLLVQSWKGKLSLRYIESSDYFDSRPEPEIYFDDGTVQTSAVTQFQRAYTINFSRQGCIETVIDDGRPAFQRLRELGVLFDSKKDAQRWLDNHIEGEKKVNLTKEQETPVDIVDVILEALTNARRHIQISNDDGALDKVNRAIRDITSERCK